MTKCFAKKTTLITIFFILSIAIFCVVFLFSPSSAKAENKKAGACLFCGTKEKEAVKEKQFADKIKIIKSVFGNQVDAAVLAATVMYIDFDTTTNKYYDENFDKKEFKDSWNGIKENLASQSKEESDWQAGDITNEKIDLLTAATIVMVLSNGFGNPYDEEAYKDALMLNSGFTDEKVTLGPFELQINDLFCSPAGKTAGSILTTIIGGFRTLNPFDDYTMSDTFTFMTHMNDICEHGFLEATYNNVKNISDEKVKENRKAKLADEIIYFAKMYKPWFGIEDKGNFCLTGGSTQATIFNEMSHDEYIQTMGPIAQADYSRTDIFASVTLAQSIVESGWGKSGLTQKANNMFGIKCSSNWTGECINMNTGEFGSGGYYVINDAFRKYPSVESSVNDHSLFFKENSRYPDHGVFNATNYSEQIQAIHNAGYATDPNYASTIIGAIKMYNLDKWDVKLNTTYSPDVCSPVGLNGWSIRTTAPTAADSAFNYVSANRGQCVWYAQGRAIEIVEELGKNGKLTAEEVNNIRSILLEPLGNGGEIYDVAKAKGKFNVSDDIQNPKPGSFISWKEPGNYGHVAVIEDVNTVDNTITITEGWSTQVSSCPNNWSCVGFQPPITMSLEDYYAGYAQHYSGNYVFSGYVYFLETK